MSDSYYKQTFIDANIEQERKVAEKMRGLIHSISDNTLYNVWLGDLFCGVQRGSTVRNNFEKALISGSTYNMPRIQKI